MDQSQQPVSQNIRTLRSQLILAGIDASHLPDDIVRMFLEYLQESGRFNDVNILHPSGVAEPSVCLKEFEDTVNGTLRNELASIFRRFQHLVKRSAAMKLPITGAFHAALRKHKELFRDKPPSVAAAPSGAFTCRDRFLLSVPVWRAAQAYELAQSQQRFGKSSPVKRYKQLQMLWNQDDFISRLDGKCKPELSCACPIEPHRPPRRYVRGAVTCILTKFRKSRGMHRCIGIDVTQNRRNSLRHVVRVCV